MNLYIRFFFTLICALFRPKLNGVMEASTVRFRVLPTDLDLNAHMNNGRYLTIMDIGRIDFIVRNGILKFAWKNKQSPIQGSAIIRYRLPLQLFQTYDVTTRIVCWDDKWAYMEQRFTFAKGRRAGSVAAVAVVKGGFYDRRRKVMASTDTLAKAIGYEGAPPAIPDYIQKWIDADHALRQELKA